jgi:formylglycine-generating enzyme required for sulfatase activity
MRAYSCGLTLALQLLIVVSSIAQAVKPPTVPRGMVMVNDTLMVSETEVTLKEYKQYLFYSLRDLGDDAYNQALRDPNINARIDSLITASIQTGRDTQSKEYKKIEKYHDGESYMDMSPVTKFKIGSKTFNYLDHPLTGITYEQAIEFCQWKTSRVQEQLEEQGSGQGSFVFSLPTVEEMEIIHRAAYEDPKLGKKYDSVAQGKTCMIFRYRKKPACESDEFVESFPARMLPVGVFGLSFIGTYDLLGNVSEMTNTKGIAKGGNYTLPASKCYVNNTQYYTKPEPWLGFRMIARFYPDEP